VQDKRRIVEETFVAGASVSVVARRNDVNSNMVFRWRREYQRGEFGPPSPEPKGPDFVSVGVIGDDGRLVRHADPIEQEAKPTAAGVVPPEPPKLPGPSAVSSLAGRVELELPGLARFTFDASLDDAALRRFITVIKELA
jgi:transposase-like protein